MARPRGPMPCPDDATALAFVEGRLPTAERSVVESHVASCGRCYATFTELGRIYGSSLRAPTDPLAPTMAAPEQSGSRRIASGPAPLASPYRADELPAGARFGRYEILGRLGEGGMGTVLVAGDSVLHRKVALKLPRREVFGSGEAEAFALAEARAIARLAHPNVVNVFDAGVEGGQVFFAMELVDGCSLTRWLADAPRSVDAILEVALQAAEGLAAMHDAGLVHRDVKPDNVLVGADGRVRITDFGLAQTGPDPGGVLMGTPAYMAPEQLYARPTDARTDQFAFATLLFEALTGRRPFEGRTLDELRWAMTSGTRARDPRVPAGLAAALDVALSTDPSRRFPSMRALVTALHEARTPAHNAHVTVNAWLSGLMGLLHVGMAIAIGRSMAAGSEPASAASEATSTAGPGGFDPAVAVLVIAAVVSIFWVPLGVVWAPLNAWGLATRRAWARTSTLVYAAMSLFTCFGAPYAVYALYSLTRPASRAFLEPGARPARRS